MAGVWAPDWSTTKLPGESGRAPVIVADDESTDELKDWAKDLVHRANARAIMAYEWTSVRFFLIEVLGTRKVQRPVV